MNRGTRVSLVCCVLAACFAGGASAQTFVERTSLLISRQSPIVRPVTGGAMIDFNSDGLMDIYREGLLQRQRRDGMFEDVRGPSGIDDLNGLTQGGIWGDYDGDGFPDLLVVDARNPPKLYHNQGYWFFVRTERRVALSGLPPIRSAAWLDANADGRLDLAVAGDLGVRVYAQSVSGNFQIRTDMRNLDPGCSLSASDYDQDRDVDLYFSACQAGGSRDAFLSNTGLGSMTLDSGAVLAANGRLGIGSVWLDFDRDGDLDLYVVNQVAEPPPELTTAVNRLYRNNGDGTFSLARDSGDTPGAPFDQAWGVAAADFDNDGWVDLYISNRIAPGLPAQVHRMLRNKGDGTFSEITSAALPLTTFPSRAAPITGDINGDGQIDLYLASEDGDRLFYNEGNSNHWLRIRLKGVAQGTEAASDGVGARIVVWSGGTPQAGQISAGSGYASQHDGLTAHFGLGPATTADSVIVHWPGGAVDRLTDISADQEVVVVVGGSAGQLPRPFGLSGPVNGHRVDLSDGNILFEWEPSEDPAGGPIAYELTIFGPGVDTTFASLASTERSVDPSFLIQSQTYFWTVVARSDIGVRGAVARRQFTFGGSTVAAPISLDMSLRPLNSGQMSFADFDGDGDLDLAMTGSTQTGGEALLYTAVDSLFPSGEIDISFKLFKDTRSILRKVRNSHVSWVDYDTDGDQDIFLAGYFQDIDGSDGLFSEIYDNLGIIRQNPSVSAPIPGIQLGDGAWADYDGDGDQDLLLAGATSLTAPWSAITTLVRNDGGVFSVQDQGFVGAMMARVAWADYDSDGDPDAFVSGQTAEGAVGLWAYRNNGGSFSPVDLGLPSLLFGSMDWSDYDGDGDLDLLMMGGVLSPDLFSGQTRVYRNDGGVMTNLGADRDLAQLGFGSARWIDFDLDGDDDIIISGAEHPFGEKSAIVYRNEDNVRFAEEFRLNGLLFASVETGDYNGDGDEEFVVLGEDEEGNPSVLFFVNLLRAEVIPPGLIQR
jgi:ASPIC/UnbV protein/VCBS repeat protein